MSQTARNRPESAKTVNVDDRHVNTPWGSTTMESLQDPKTVSYSQRNGSESTKTAGVDDRHVNALRGLSIVEITLGPQNNE